MVEFSVHLKEAIEGLVYVVKTEKTFQLHLMISVPVILAAFYFGFSQTEWLILATAISMVLAAEAFNTAIETFTAHLIKERHTSIKLVKDISAGAVLITVINSIVVGLILFYPRILIFLYQTS